MKRPFECLKKLFGFPLQERSSICEELIRAYPSSKKNLHWSMIGRTLHIGKTKKKQGVSEQTWFVPKTAGRFETVTAVQPQKTLQFLPSCKIGNSFSSTQTVTKLLYKYEHSSLSPSHIPRLREHPHNRTKYKSKETSKIPISQIISESEMQKIWK